MTRLGINKGDHNVSCSTGGRQPLVVVCEAPRVHHGPTKTGVHNTAVVTNKSGTTSLVWCMCGVVSRCDDSCGCIYATPRAREGIQCT